MFPSSSSIVALNLKMHWAWVQEAVAVTGLTSDTSRISKLEVGPYTSGKVIQEIFISYFSRWWVLTFWVKQTFNEWEKYLKLYLSISKYIPCFSLLPRTIFLDFRQPVLKTRGFWKEHKLRLYFSRICSTFVICGFVQER